MEKALKEFKLHMAAAGNRKIQQLEETKGHVDLKGFLRLILMTKNADVKGTL